MLKKITFILGSLGILLRIIPIWIMPTWYDESFTILLARLPLDKLFQATIGDVHPPLYYLICYPLAHIPGIPPWAIIRIPALLAGIGCIFVWYKILGIMVLDPKVKLFCFGLFCLLPEQIYYSQEGRMYSLLTLLVLLSWLFILNRKWVILAVTISLMLWLQNYGMLYAAALWIAAIIYYKDPKIIKPITLSMGAGAITFIPWIIILLKQMRGIYGYYWIMRFSGPSVLGDLFHSFFGTSLINADIVNFIVFYGLLIWVLIWGIRNNGLNYPVLVLSFLPWILAIIISILWQPMVLYRALIPSGVFITLILTEPLQYLSNRSMLLIGIFFLPALLTNVVGIVIRPLWADWIILEGKAIDIVDNNWAPGDLLYYTNDGTYVTGSVNWKNIDNAIRVIPCGITYGSLSNTTRLALGMIMGPYPDNIHGRTWVITSETPLDPPCQTQYLIDKGLLKDPPLYCSHDDAAIKSCVYMVGH